MKQTNKSMVAVKKTLDMTMIIIFAVLGLAALYTVVALDNMYVQGGMILVVGVMILLHVLRQSADDASILE